MKDSKIYLNLIEYRQAIYATGLLSFAFLAFSGSGDFQKVAVYKHCQGKDPNIECTYQIAKEFDKNPEDRKGHVIARIQNAQTYTKMIAANLSLILGCACLFLSNEQERDTEARNYKEVARSQVQKMDIDSQTAAFYKIMNEKTTIIVSDLMDELFANPIYAEALRNKLATQEGRGTDDEEATSNKEEKDVWGSLAEDDEPVAVDSQAKKPLLSDADYKAIIDLHTKDAMVLRRAITTVTGYKDGTEEFLLIGKELVARLNNGTQ